MSAAPDNSPACYRVGDLILDTGSRRVTREGESLKLGGLTFDLLQTLAEASPSMVTYDVLAERVWNGRAVTPETIAQRAKMLRDALGDDAKSPRYLELVRGQGYRLAVDAEKTRNPASRPAVRRSVTWIAAAVAAAALMILLVVQRDVGESVPSVAVLPFADMSQAGDQKYLADGIAEELINQLARLGGLDVVSRTESFYFRGENGDPRSIGERLNVTAILEGSVRRSEDDIRVTVQLIDTGSGYHLWSQNFDRQLEDLFAIQDEIASAVAGTLGVKLGVGATDGFRGAGTRDIDAYEAYLRGDYAKAIELDPGYAAAWGQRGISIAGTMWTNPPQEAPGRVERAQLYARKAIELDPQSSRAHTSLATITYPLMAWNEAEEIYAKALSLRRDAFSLGHYANMLMRAGRSTLAQEIRREREAMLRLPDGPHRLPMEVQLALGQFEEVKPKIDRLDDRGRDLILPKIALHERSLHATRATFDKMSRTSYEYLELYRPVVELLDTPEAALSFLDELSGDPQRVWPSKYTDIALVAAYLDDPDFALEQLVRELRYTPVRFGVLWYPLMTDVRKLPGFKAFVTDVNLVDYWRAYGWSDFCRPRGEDDFVCE